MGHPADLKLLHGLRTGDEMAFKALFAAYQERVYSFLYRLSGSRAEADDAFQDTWLRIAKSSPELPLDVSLTAWVLTVARNTYFKRWRKERTQSRLPEQASVERGDAPSPEDAAASRQNLARVAEALHELPLASREAVILVLVEGLDQIEAASILRISHAALRQRLARARAELVACFEATSLEEYE